MIHVPATDCLLTVILLAPLSSQAVPFISPSPSLLRKCACYDPLLRTRSTATSSCPFPPAWLPLPLVAPCLQSYPAMQGKQPQVPLPLLPILLQQLRLLMPPVVIVVVLRSATACHLLLHLPSSPSPPPPPSPSPFASSGIRSPGRSSCGGLPLHMHCSEPHSLGREGVSERDRDRDKARVTKRERDNEREGEGGRDG